MTTSTSTPITQTLLDLPSLINNLLLLLSDKEKTVIKKRFNLDGKKKHTLEEIGKDFVRWIEIVGLSNIKMIESIGKKFSIHPLVLEDILNPNQRPKFEDYGDFVFIVLTRIIWNEKDENFETEQINIIIGLNYVISISESESEIFAPIKKRIHIILLQL